MVLAQPPANEPWSLTARWVFPVEGPPLPRGVVTVQADRLLAVEPQGTRQADLDLGNVAILPGLVNAHTHLDLSDARGKCPPTSDFTGWLRQVIAHRHQQTPGDVARAIRAGIEQSSRHGVTLVGDISAGGASWSQLATASLRATVFYEVLGLSASRAAAARDALVAWLESRPTLATCRPAFSLHAPYSVRSSLFAELGGGRVGPRSYPVAIHVAESAAELELLEKHTGPFVPFLQDLGAWDPAGLAPDLAAVFQGETAHSLFIHGNCLSPDAGWPRAGALVYCPRTHAAFGQPRHPFRDFLGRGVRVVLATDSLASNPDLDVLAEARFVHQLHAEVPGATLLAMITRTPAEILGWGDEVGSLAPGKLADLVILPLPDEEPADPHDLILKSHLPVQAVLFGGQGLASGEASNREQDNSVRRLRVGS